MTVHEPQGRHRRAVRLLESLGPGGGAIIPLQVLGELLNVCRQKNVLPLGPAIERVRQFLAAFDCPATNAEDLIAAAALSGRHSLQFFDALILTVARRSGAQWLLSEDLQDGARLDGIRIINPFDIANDNALADALSARS